MQQSKRWSMIEVSSSMIIGYILAMCITMIILPWYGADVTWGGSFTITAIFTVVSFARNYAVRRLFNWIQIKLDKQ